MTVTALDYGSDRVEGGDAVLVSSDCEYLLMDTANNDDTGKVIRYLKARKIRKLSLYLSHWHEDHFFYLWQLMDDPYFHIKRLYLPKTTWVRNCAGARYSRRSWYENAVRCWSGIPAAGLYGAREVIKKAKTEKIPVTYLKKGSSFRIGKARARVIWCGCRCTLSKGFFEYMNDRSLVTKITAGGLSYLTAGDITKEVFDLMKQKQVDPGADLYKLSHHGASDTPATIKMIKPAFAFYCDSTEKRGKWNLSTGKRRKISKLTNLYSVRKNGNITFRFYGRDAADPIRVSTQRQ